jgi:hypothetical protein
MMVAATVKAGSRPARALMLVLLGGLSLLWTVSVAGSGGASLAYPYLPDGVRPAVVVPEGAVDVPASLTSDGQVVARPVRVATVAATSSQIPAVALAAYQRAATVMAAADESCGVEWPVLAAIGKVESGHGSANGNVLRADGLADPGVIGVRLDGRRSTALVSDTDGGRYDRDRSFDRGVGPMQFIPSTWGVVGVDADGDGRRDPQDIDDAALAAAVHLCGGDGDLSTRAGLHSALLGYNHSGLYAETVLAVADSYAASDVPESLTAGRAVLPGGSVGPPERHPAATRKQARRELAKAAPASAARAEGTSGAGGDAGGGSAGSGSGGTGRPASGGADGGAAPAPRPLLKPVADLLGTTTGVLQCTLGGLTQLLQLGETPCSPD